MSGRPPDPPREIRTPPPPFRGEPGEAAKNLVLQLVRTQAEARSCPNCGQTLEDCRLALRAMEIDRLVVEMTCDSCANTFTLTVTPSADEGTASIK